MAVRQRKVWGWAIAATAALVLAAWAVSGLHVQQALVGWIASVRGSRWGVPIFSAVYVVSTVLLLPASLLTLVAGFLYGPLWGLLLVSPVSVVAAVAAFAVGRSFGRGWVARRLEGSPRVAAIDQAIGSEGLKLVILLRLSPVLPFNLLNYALALTRVRFRDYLIGSAVGMLPGTFLYVYLGSLVTSTGALLSGKRPDAGPLGSALYWGGLAATAAATVVITRVARRALQETLAREHPTREAA